MVCYKSSQEQSNGYFLKHVETRSVKKFQSMLNTIIIIFIILKQYTVLQLQTYNKNIKNAHLVIMT